MCEINDKTYQRRTILIKGKYKEHRRRLPKRISDINPKKTITMRFEIKLREEFNKLAKEHGYNFSRVLHMLLREFIKKHKEIKNGS